MAGYDRLIDCLMEDPAVLKRLHVDVSRVCTAELANAAELTNERADP
jgi:hypothetical protein